MFNKKPFITIKLKGKQISVKADYVNSGLIKLFLYAFAKSMMTDLKYEKESVEEIFNSVAKTIKECD